MDKKGAINLSINMIIVLIIAIVILGFALSFVTKMFRQGEVALSGQFPEVKVAVTRDNPIGIGSEFLVREGEVRKVNLKVMNTGSTNIDSSDGTSDLTITCEQSSTLTVSPYERKNIAAGDSATIKAVITGGNSMVNNDICTISVGEVESTFFLNTE